MRITICRFPANQGFHSKQQESRCVFIYNLTLVHEKYHFFFVRTIAATSTSNWVEKFLLPKLSSCTSATSVTRKQVRSCPLTPFQSLEFITKGVELDIHKKEIPLSHRMLTQTTGKSTSFQISTSIQLSREALATYPLPSKPGATARRNVQLHKTPQRCLPLSNSVDR